jgi:carbon monoxide dehydrogenase subunit G
MPASTLEFHSDAALALLRARLADPSFVASLIPQVVAVESTGPTTARWTVLVKLGPISRKSLYEGELLEATDASVRFRAKGPEATIEGTLGLRPGAPSGTEITLTLTMNGQGPLHSVVDAYLAKRVKSDVEQFAKSLNERLTGAAPESS